MKNTIKTLVFALMMLIFNSCVINNNVKGNGDRKTETRTINSEITNLVVSNAIQVKLTQGDTPELKVTADSNIINHIETKQEGSTLYIKTAFGTNLDFNNDVIVNLKIPNIYNISTSSASSVEGKNTIISKELTLETSSSSLIEIALETEQLTVDSSSASEVILNGKAINVQLDSSSSSTINAGQLLANNIIAKASSASEIKCNPIINLEARASSSGDIKFVNKPKYIKKSESSAGNVTGN